MKLDDIDKRNIFEIPERYFDTLPMRVQERLPRRRLEKRQIAWKMAVAALVPATLVLMLFVYPGFLRNVTATENPEKMLAEIAIVDVVAYLESADISTEDILENTDPELLEISIESVSPLFPHDMGIDGKDMNSIMEYYNYDAEIYENI
jgi:hypothetical protein